MAGASSLTLLVAVLSACAARVPARPVLDLSRPAVSFTISKGEDDGDRLNLQLSDATRLIAPCRSVKGRWCVDEIPSERLSTQAVLLDLREAIGRNRSSAIGRDVLEDVLNRALKGVKDKETGRVLLLLTGYREDWPQPEGANTADGANKDNGGAMGPVLTLEASQWLADNYTGVAVVGVGTDANSIGSDEALHAFAERNLFVLESLQNLEVLVPVVGGRTAGNSLVVALPIRLRGAEVAPARVLVVPAPPPEADSRASAGAEQRMAFVVLSVMASAARVGKGQYC